MNYYGSTLYPSKNDERLCVQEIQKHWETVRNVDKLWEPVAPQENQNWYDLKTGRELNVASSWCGRFDPKRWLDVDPETLKEHYFGGFFLKPKISSLGNDGRNIERMQWYMCLNIEDTLKSKRLSTDYFCGEEKKEYFICWKPEGR